MSTPPTSRDRSMLSCDRCRLRKIKCIRTSAGPCERCKGSSQPCRTSSAKRSRPYYQTSKEQYELMASIVHHFLPGVPLETDDLRRAVSMLPNTAEDQHGCTGRHSRQQASQPAMVPPPAVTTIADDDDAAHQSQPQHALCATPPPSVAPGASEVSDPAVFSDAIAVMRCAKGSNWSTFYQQVRSNLARTRAALLRTQPTLDVFDNNQVPAVVPDDLPPRSVVDQSSSRFFAEVNTGTCILDYVQFHTGVENLYCHGQPTSNAFLQILQLVIALGQDSAAAFERAAAYASGALREGSFQSIEALMLSALFNLGHNQRNMAWIDIGCAIRISQSLGLHVSSPDANNTAIQSLNGKRIWWALQNMETFLSCMLGRPPSTGEDHAGALDNQETQQVSTDPWTPHGYLSASASLTNIICRLLRRFYWAPSPDNPAAVVQDILNRLQAWWDDLPPGLRPGHLATPSYLRAITALTLRYYHTLMLLTRPYLLYSANNADSCSSKWAGYVAKCEQANEASSALLVEMAQKGLLSELSFFNSHYILGNGAILFLRCLKSPTSELVISKMKELLPLVLMTERLNSGKWSAKSFVALLDSVEKSQAQERGLEPAETASPGEPSMDAFLDINQMMDDIWEIPVFGDLNSVYPEPLAD